MYPVLPPAESLFRALAALDYDAARDARERRCECSGPLHWATWNRKPRGLDLPDALCVRWGLCCGRCRRRVLAPSARFTGRRVYVKAVLLLVVAARQRGRAQHSMARLRQLFGVSATTIPRWMKAFLDGLPPHPDWQRLRAHIPGVGGATVGIFRRTVVNASTGTRSIASTVRQCSVSPCAWRRTWPCTWMTKPVTP